ncbi:MAG: glucosylceramidase [Clostridia bacterium]|nr:glucosylceramidase [Clostridia bacterium]
MIILDKHIWRDGEIVPSRFEEITDNSDPINKWAGGDRVEIYHEEKQTVIGFGGAFTEASAYNYAQLDKDEKKKALDLLFGQNGLRYNFCRLCMGSSDFSLDGYTYVENDDPELRTFSIERDKKYIIPFVKDALEYTGGKITLLASPWSPPVFMKTTDELIHGGQLKKEYYPVFARYFRLFLEEYDKEGVRIDYITPMNEPRKQKWQSCEFTFEDMADFIDILADELNSNLSWHVNILCWDFNRGGMYPHAKTVFEKTGNKVCGTAFHWYSGQHLGELKMMHDFYPDKLLIETEFCHGLGSKFFGHYCTEYIDVLDNWANGSVEWNMILDENGGPYFARDFGCNSTLFRSSDNRIEKRGVYTQSYMFSHYIDKNAAVLYTSSAKKHLMTLAVKNPDGKILLYIYNDSHVDDFCTVYIDNIKFKIQVPESCLILYELK